MDQEAMKDTDPNIELESSPASLGEFLLNIAVKNKTLRDVFSTILFFVFFSIFPSALLSYVGLFILLDMILDVREMYHDFQWFFCWDFLNTAEFIWAMGIGFFFSLVFWSVIFIVLYKTRTENEKNPNDSEILSDEQSDFDPDQ